MNSFKTKSGQQVFVRELSLNDVHPLSEFYRQLSQEDTYIWANPDEPSSYQDQKTEVDSYIDNRANKLYLVAYHHYTLVGYVSMDQGGKRRRHVGDFGLIVAKDFRRVGLGEMLSRLIIKEAKRKWGLKVILLDTFDINTPAISLYKKLVSTIYGQRQGTVWYQGKYIGEVMMQLNLN